MTSADNIEEIERVQTVGLTGRNIIYTVYSSSPDTSGDEVQIELTTGLHGNTFVHEYRKRYLPAIIHIQFEKCPFGFFSSETDSSLYACQCDTSKEFNCSIQSQIIKKIKGSWLGEFVLDNHTYLATNRYCPLDYCNSSFFNIKSNPHNLSQDEQCRYNRTGVLCGSCPEGWSLVLGSSECRENCSNVWLLLILPFVLAGLLLVLIIHFLNLTVTMGTVCGLIFYANIVQNYAITILSQEPVPGLTVILQLFLSWLNLDLGISTCFYTGMEAFGKTMFLFAFPIYIWLISATIIILSNRYIFFTKLFGSNALKVLSTLFLLSYSKMLRVTIGIMNLKSIAIYDATIVRSVRWILDSNISYFDSQHLLLIVMASLFILLLLPFTLSLLCIRHVYSLSNYCRVFSRVDKLKPFFDTYTGPFKDRARFWPGLLLFARLFLLIVYSMDYGDYVIPYYATILVCFVLIAIMIIIHGVYEKKILNVLECFFILNISTLFLIETHKEKYILNSIFSHILVSSAFLVFIGILAYHAYLKLSGSRLARLLMFKRRAAEVNLLSFEESR